MSDIFTETYLEHTLIPSSTSRVWVKPPLDWGEWVLTYTEDRHVEGQVKVAGEWKPVYHIERTWTYIRVRSC